MRLREQAKRCMRLAQSINDPATVGVLVDMARELEQKATALECTTAPDRGPDAASWPEITDPHPLSSD